MTEVSKLMPPLRAESLFNAVKKQFGLHTYLMPLTLPDSPPQQPTRLPSPIPRLPPLSLMELSPMPPAQIPDGIESMLDRPTTPRAGSATLSTNAQPQSPRSPVQHNALALNDNDIQQFGRFVREFVVMSLIPWMEKCVVEWNESVSSHILRDIRCITCIRSLNILFCSTHLRDVYRPVYSHQPVVFSALDIPSRLPPHRHPDMGTTLRYLL